MKHCTSDFDYFLPPELIAQIPLPDRTASRLLCVNRQNGAIEHREFSALLQLLKPEDLLVFNDTRVIPARLFGRKLTGGKIEVLIERILKPHSALVQIKSNKSLKIATKLILEDRIEAEIVGRRDELFELSINTSEPLLTVLKQWGHLPLPRYIKRQANNFDAHRYQTIFGVKDGAVAAPTAGLHFDEKLLQKINSNFKTAFVTLHVGAGTFKPVLVQNIHEHKMHAEMIEVSSSVCELIKETRQRNGRVIAVGTTTVRALETANKSGVLLPYSGDTDIFITPGFHFQCVDAMITNFHLPQSSLLILVSAFAGLEKIRRSYQTAIAEKYRFYSYGDAMWISD